MKKNLKTRLMALLLCVIMIMSVSCASAKPATSTPAASTPADPGTDDPGTDDPGTDDPGTDDPGTDDPGIDPDLPANGAQKIVTESKKLYSTAENVELLDVAYYESTPEILLISTDTMISFFFNSFMSGSTSFTFEETEDTLTITKANGAYCMIDFVVDVIYFDNFDLFCASRSNSTSDIISNPYLDSKGNSIYFQTTNTKNIAGLPLYLDLAEKDIPLDVYEGKKYMTLQTFNDIFLVPYAVSCVYNGQDLYLAQGGKVDASVEAQYYSVGPVERSEALAEFTANEFCLAMETYYGLQDEHGVIVGFDLFLYYAGLWDKLTSKDASTSSAALFSLAFGALADGHTSLTLTSPYSGSKSLDQSQVEIAPSMRQFFTLETEMKTLRGQLMPDGVPAYQEIGNTAYITFDNFTLSTTRWQDYDEAAFQTADTLGIIIYAHSMITRENSPIENVVLDLSCNTGGAADAAVYVVAWMLGYCDLSMTNPITNSFSTTTYKVDVNLDGVFDAKDTVADKNLYCITSPVSFSCGNLVPALLKESGKVTILGGTSGGGACAVNFLTLADGSAMTVSSPLHLTVVSNGSYYTIDRGVEPHYFFGKQESYFERNSLTEFINNLR
jgi:hypothetical protein